MSSKIQVQRICQFCNNEFLARTTVTRYCSHKCACAAHKRKLKIEKVEQSNTETQKVRAKSINDIKIKEFLTVRDVAILLNCSLRTTYRLIEEGNIKAVNLSKRKTLVKRSNIDRLFEQPRTNTPQAKIVTDHREYKISEYYTTEEVRIKYNISESTLRSLIIKHNIPKYRSGWYAYIPKEITDNLLSKVNTNSNGDKS